MLAGRRSMVWGDGYLTVAIKDHSQGAPPSTLRRGHRIVQEIAQQSSQLEDAQTSKIAGCRQRLNQ
jgi:hypothetical protein